MNSNFNDFSFLGNYNSIIHRGILFEQFISTILLRIANKYDQKIFFNGQNGSNKINANFHNYDAYAPDGIDNIKGMVYIEIKTRVNLQTIEILYNKFKENKKDNSKFLIITYSNNTKKLTYDDLIVWDYDKINKLRKEYTFDAFNYFEEKFKLSKEEFFEFNESNKVLLKDIFINNKRHITLVLGAGVSKDFELPTWDALIKDFLKKIKSKKGISNFDYIFSKIGDSSLIKGQFIIDNFSSKFNILDKEKDFCTELQKLFYKGKKYSPKLATTLQSVAELINRYKNFEIITYNYDDLLEKTLDNINIINYKSIYKDGNLRKDFIPIFHVHGYLPREGDITDEISESIVFSEYKYHKLFNNPYLWQLSCQLTRFRESVCLFIGFSLFDPSVRRLLESIILSNPLIKHYAIFARESEKPADLIDYATIIRHFSRLGVQIIWLDTYNDIPNFIDNL